MRFFIFFIYINRPRGREMTKIPRWCEHCNRPGHTCEKCWKLHGTPTRGYKGCAPQDSTSDKDKLFNMQKSPNKERIKGTYFNYKFPPLDRLFVLIPYMLMWQFKWNELIFLKYLAMVTDRLQRWIGGLNLEFT